MALSADARPKRKSKKVYDPYFLYDFPSGELFHDHDDDLNLDEESDPVPLNPPPIKQSAKPAKSKSATAHSAPPLPLSVKDTAPSTLSFDQQLQLIKLQKEKLELELKVLTISRQERPAANTQADFSTQDTAETVEPRRSKRTIDWPQDFVPSIQGDYDKLELPEFVSGFLIMIKSYDPLVKDAMLAHLELLTIKAISYSWVSVRAFHKFIAKQVEQRRLDWQDLKSIQDQATTFFRHSDLRNSRPRNETPRLNSGSASPGNNQQAAPSIVPKACRTWNYTGACECDQQDTAAYKEHHRCRVCKADHPMLHCSKRRTPIPPQWELLNNGTHSTTSLTRNGHGHESFNTSAVVRHLIASRHAQPNAFGARVLVPTSLLLSNWRILLSNYQDKIVIDFLSYGWPINYTAPTCPVSSLHNHPLASQFASHVQDYIDT